MDFLHRCNSVSGPKQEWLIFFFLNCHLHQSSEQEHRNDETQKPPC